MKITIIAGARPNFMKIAPLMRAINAAKAAGKNISARLVYTGSDEDKSLEPSLFTDLDMPRPDAYLRVDDTDFFQRMAGIVVAFARELEKHPAQIVIVVDDLPSAFTRTSSAMRAMCPSPCPRRSMSTSSQSSFHRLSGSLPPLSWSCSRRSS